MKRTDKENLKEDAKYILQGVGIGAMLCLGFVAGVAASRHYSRPSKLSIITNKAVTKPGVRITPNKYGKLIGNRGFLFRNCQEANEFVDLFNQCILDCSKNSGVS